MNRDVEGLMHQWLGCRKGWVTSQETDILSKLVNQGLKALYVFFRFFGLGKKGLVIICKFGHCCLELTSTIQFGQNQGRPSMRLWRSRASCDTPMHLVCAHPSQRSQHRALLFVLTVLEHERQLILLLMGMMVGIKQSVVG